MNYYQDPAVQARIVEFLGGPTLEEATAVYLNRSDKAIDQGTAKCPPAELGTFLDNSVDIARSLWDRESLVADLDIEYVNFDFEAEPFLDPARSFDLQQPVVETVERLLVGFGISPLHLISGRGHHFVWRIRQDSAAYAKLVSAGHVSESLHQRYEEFRAPTGEAVPHDMAMAFSGLGLVMEYLAHRIKKEAFPESELPLELTAVAVGPSHRGREMISLDISEYGDPLLTRAIRVPFSLYRKPWAQEVAGHQQIEPRQVAMVPLHEMNIREALEVMRDPERTAALARRVSVQIPEQSKPSERLIHDYEHSSLKQFHDWYHSQEHQPPEAWPDTYDRTPLDVLPPCVRHILEHPNDLLLKPVGIEQVVRCFLALGWHPRHIAGLIRSKYERDFGWVPPWDLYDPGMRADFYTRVFAGLFIDGPDELVDFNCQSTKERGFCFHPQDGCDLHHFRESLMERKTNDRLACRPFNRLLL